MKKQTVIQIALLILGIAAPFLFPAYTLQIALLWIMILFALTWDIMGGQMGYNSLGNIFYFGIGMYICAVVQVGVFYDVAEYTSAYGAIKPEFTDAQYFGGLALGIVAAAIGCVIFAITASIARYGTRNFVPLLANNLRVKRPKACGQTSGRRDFDSR